MIKNLSVRNARRQAQDYLIYFITLVVAASLMFGLNLIIFSKDIIFALQNAGTLRNMMVIASAIIILILSWLVRYMMNFMLKKRSKELSIYMILGIENKTIVRMFLMENLLIGAFAFLLGYIGGAFVFNILKAIVMNLIGLEYKMGFDFSINAIVLTAVYFMAMYVLSLIRSTTAIKKLGLYNLLYYEKQNENNHITKNPGGILVFLFSLLCLTAALYIFTHGPFGDELNFPVGIFLIAAFTYCFFASFPKFVVAVLGVGTWRYKGNRTIILRYFTSKINSMSKVMGFLSIVFAISLLLISIGMIGVATYNYRASLALFDFSIASEKGMERLAVYRDYINENFKVREDYAYNIYQSNTTAFSDIDFGFISYSYMPVNMGKNDLCMTYRDYSYLREMLGYSPVDMGDNEYLIHCFSYFKNAIEKHAERNPRLEIGGFGMEFAGIYTESFEQYDGFSNGHHYILIVPDYAIDDLSIRFSRYSVITKQLVTHAQIEQLLAEFDSLKSFRSGSGNGSFVSADYLDAKAEIQQANGRLYSTEVLPIWYVAVILCITGITILASNIVSDEARCKRQFGLLRSIGYSRRSLDCILLWQLAILFIVPAVPSILFAAVLSPIYAKNFGADVFVPQSVLWFNIFLALVVYLTIYLIYYIASYVLLRKNVESIF